MKYARRQCRKGRKNVNFRSSSVISMDEEEVIGREKQPLQCRIYAEQTASAIKIRDAMSKRRSLARGSVAFASCLPCEPPSFRVSDRLTGAYRSHCRG